MEQRAPRLGDIVDDYCPRERRITNHAIVAIVEDAIRQTRCTTCEAEHVFKQGREPRRRSTPETAYDQVLASVTAGERVVARTPDAAPVPAAPASPAPGPEPASGAEPRVPEPAPVAGGAHDAGFAAHRQLIRASLPKSEGDVPPPRAIPEFTMHQRPAGRGGGRAGQEVDGNSTNYIARDYRQPRAFHGNGNGHANGHGRGHGAGRGPGPSGRPDGNGSGAGAGGGDRLGGRGRPGRRRGRQKREQ